MNKVTITFGAYITLLRTSKGFTVSGLAEVAGISRNYLTQIEHNADRKVSVDMLLKLAKALEMDGLELINFYAWSSLGGKIRVAVSMEGSPK